MENESSTQDNAEQELKRLEDKWLNSYLRGDKQTFDLIINQEGQRVTAKKV